MDLYAPVSNALANTQATIVDLMKTFMSNEIAKQAMDLEKEKLGQANRGLDLEAERNRQAAQREAAEQDRLRQAREDALRARGEDVTFRTQQAEQQQVQAANQLEREKFRDTFSLQKEQNEEAYRNKMLSFKKGEESREKQKFDAQYGKTTIGQIGQQMGIDPFVWGFMNVNKDSPTTPERFEKMITSPYMAYALPRAAVIRHTEQLKTMEKQILTEKDPAKKEQIKANYDALSGQIDILRDAIERGPDKGLVTAVIKEMGITDPEEAASAMETITKRWKKMQGEFAQSNGRPSDKFNAPEVAPAAGKNGVTPEILELKQYFQVKNPAVLREAAAIIQKDGQAAGIDFLRKKRQELQSNAQGNAEGDTFGIRPGSVLSDIAGAVRRVPNLPDYESEPGLTF